MVRVPDCPGQVISVALVSPTDLAKAVTIFPKLRLPVRVKTFKSGLVVIMDSSATEEVIGRDLLRMAETGVTAMEVGGKFNWSVAVTMELLQVSPSRMIVANVDGGGEGSVMSGRYH